MVWFFTKISVAGYIIKINSHFVISGVGGDLERYGHRVVVK